ncbi:MAG: hypothetical protein PHR43_00650 [Dehalococcoidales bacterium]|nr:hypothetical protein [Dehalococcoidales bacterium]
MANSDREKLKILLAHWVEHNNEHRDEFREWAEKAKILGEAEVDNLMQKAAREMHRSGDYLLQALKKLGG